MRGREIGIENQRWTRKRTEIVPMKQPQDVWHSTHSKTQMETCDRVEGIFAISFRVCLKHVASTIPSSIDVEAVYHAD